MGRMNFEEMLATFGVYGASVIVGILSGLLPLPVGESFLLALSSEARVSWWALQGSILIVVAIQTAIRIPMFYAGTRADHVPSKRWRERLERARKKVEKWQDKPKWILFIAAVFGLPPYYLAVIVAGILKMPLRTFLIVSLVGRLIHYGAIAASPYLFR